MTRKFTYFVVAMISLVGFLMMLFPASLFWRFFLQELVQNKVSAQRIYPEVTQITGTVWNGSARIVHISSSVLTWRLVSFSFLEKRVVYDLSFKGVDHQLETQVSTDGNTIGISNTQGQFLSQFVTQATEPYGGHIDGDIYIEFLEMSMGMESPRPLSADGQFRWTGGRAQFLSASTAGTKAVSQHFPELIGKLSFNDDITHFVATHENQSLLKIDLLPDGWLRVDATAPEAGENSTFVFEEKLW